MLRLHSSFYTQIVSRQCLKQFTRFEGNDIGWDNIKSIKANKWPILKGNASAELTKLAKSHYLKKRILNIVPKTGWEISCLGYGCGGSRVYNDDWSGEMQRACRFGTNFIQIFLTVNENFLDENYSGNPAGYIPPHGMFHGLLTADEIDRGSMVVSSKIYSHQRSGQAYSPQLIQKMVDISLNQMGVDVIDMLTLEIPPFITESQLAMALYHLKSEIDAGRIGYLTIGSTFSFTAGGYNPLEGKRKQDSKNVDISSFSFSFITLMRMIKDVGLLDKLIGIEIPMNVTECATATSPLPQEYIDILRMYMSEPPTGPMTLLEAMKQCNLAIFVDRCFEGYKRDRPVRLIDFTKVDTDNLLMNMKESFEICRYLEDFYRKKIRPSITSLPEGHVPLPDPDSFQFGFVLPTVMLQAESLMVWEDLRHSAIEPALREGINQLAGISEDVKKWCFSYRLATSNMLDYITKAFKAKEIGYVEKIDETINRICPEYDVPSLRFYYKMLDNILSLGVTSVFTDMIHIHSNDVMPPILSEERAKEVLSKLILPEDKVHLINMNDYEFHTEEPDIKTMREKISYLEENETVSEKVTSI